MICPIVALMRAAGMDLRLAELVAPKYRRKNASNSTCDQMATDLDLVGSWSYLLTYHTYPDL